MGDDENQARRFFFRSVPSAILRRMEASIRLGQISTVCLGERQFSLLHYLTQMLWLRRVCHNVSAYNAGDPGLIPGLGISPGEGNGNPLQYSCLENPIDQEPGRLQSTGLQRIGHDWATSLHFTSLHTDATRTKASPGERCWWSTWWILRNTALEQKWSLLALRREKGKTG